MRPRRVVGSELVDMPTGLVMGVPTDLESLARSGVLSAQALARIPLDHVLKSVDAVTPAAMQKVAGDIFDKRRFSTVVIRPS